MAIFSKEMCRQKLNTWLAAEESVATGQSYQIGTRMLTRADLKQIREEMEYWAQKLSEAEAEEKNGGRKPPYHFFAPDVGGVSVINKSQPTRLSMISYAGFCFKKKKKKK